MPTFSQSGDGSQDLCIADQNILPAGLSGARTARTPSRGKSTEMLSARVLAATGWIVSVSAEEGIGDRSRAFCLHAKNPRHLVQAIPVQAGL